MEEVIAGLLFCGGLLALGFLGGLVYGIEHMKKHAKPEPSPWQNSPS